MDRFIFTNGQVTYTGPVTLIAWMFMHPWMTLIIVCTFLGALEELFKAIGKWGKRK